MRVLPQLLQGSLLQLLCVIRFLSVAEQGRGVSDLENLRVSHNSLLRSEGIYLMPAAEQGGKLSACTGCGDSDCVFHPRGCNSWLKVSRVPRLRMYVVPFCSRPNACLLWVMLRP